jgi:hypothetical protein
LIALAGVGLTQFFSAGFRRQDRQWRQADEARQRLVERGEELYRLVVRWKMSSEAMLKSYQIFFDAKLEAKDLLKAIEHQTQHVDEIYHNIEVLISVYFPRLSHYLPQVHDHALLAHKFANMNLYDIGRGVAWNHGSRDGVEQALAYAIRLLTEVCDAIVLEIRPSSELQSDRKILT